MPQDPTILPGMYQPHSGSGVRRPMKQSGSTGNTKLDLLKAKTVPAQSSMISPINSPQSQASTWNEPSSPQSSSNITSPVSSQQEVDRHAAFLDGRLSLPSVYEFQHDFPTVTTTGQGHVGFSSFPTPDSSLHSRALHGSIDETMHTGGVHETYAIANGNWGTYYGGTSGKLTPQIRPLI